MSYFDKWKVKSNIDDKIEIKNFQSKPDETKPKPSKIIDFIKNEKSDIKIIDIPEQLPEMIDYSGPVTIEKIKPKELPQQTLQLVSFLDKQIEKTIYVYTDGSCINNGKKNAKAGIGIFFAENDPRNVSKIVNGKQTNNVAELTAILVAIDILKKEIDEGKRIIIYTDSEYAIKCFTTYGRRLAANGFISKDPIPNLDLIKIGLSKMKSNIILQHIRSHTGKKDQHSLGNEQADLLANKAIGIESKPDKIYLKVSYGNKDQAKEMGAKWDKKRKMWYVHNMGHQAVRIFGTME